MKNIPDIIIGRLPRYLQVLQRLSKEGVQTTSSQELGKLLGISSAQIRKDLSQFGEFGKQGTGYSIAYLISQLKSILNVNVEWTVALVGAGDMGHALVRYPGFALRGFRITAVFDNDPKKIGQKIGNISIDNVATLQETLTSAGIKIAMLTVPATEAQHVADLLVECGVKAILNYTSIVLKVPPDVQVKDIDPINSLQHMTYYL
ncbi:MAG: redox-sensing transcriptional repressor Rex [Anaerolineaceae bacterium]|nr:redox-sensing transcriptional repressor Rex [Anaerolineaceae bacterium]